METPIQSKKKSIFGTLLVIIATVAFSYYAYTRYQAAPCKVESKPVDTAAVIAPVIDTLEAVSDTAK